MSEITTIPLEYVGPPNQEWFDGTQYVTLVAGRRYQVDSKLADYLCASAPTHWTRPSAPAAKAAATKE